MSTGTRAEEHRGAPVPRVPRRRARLRRFCRCDRVATAEVTCVVDKHPDRIGRTQIVSRDSQRQGERGGGPAAYKVPLDFIQWIRARAEGVPGERVGA